MTPHVRACRVCGCTDADCSGCVERTGHPCWWVEAPVRLRRALNSYRGVADVSLDRLDRLLGALLLLEDPRVAPCIEISVDGARRLAVRLVAGEDLRDVSSALEHRGLVEGIGKVCEAFGWQRTAELNFAEVRHG